MNETKNKHTPGPWKVYSEYKDETEIVVPSKNGGPSKLIAELTCSPYDGEERQANARLIAKAPEMFEALNMLLVEYKSLIPLIGQTPQEVAIVGHVESLLNSIQDGGGK